MPTRARFGWTRGLVDPTLDGPALDGPDFGWTPRTFCSLAVLAPAGRVDAWGCATCGPDFGWTRGTFKDVEWKDNAITWQTCNVMLTYVKMSNTKLCKWEHVLSFWVFELSFVELATVTIVICNYCINAPLGLSFCRVLAQGITNLRNLKTTLRNFRELL